MGTPTGKDGKQLVTPDQFSVITDVIERAWHQWPAYPDDDNPYGHTSDYARVGAARIVDALGMTTVPANTIPYPESLPETMRDLWDQTADEHKGDQNKFVEQAMRLYDYKLSEPRQT
jgi:hypothetical protein